MNLGSRTIASAVTTATFAAGILLAGMATQPVHASTTTITDPRNDPGTRPTTDIRKAAISNGGKRASARVKMSEVNHKGVLIVLEIDAGRRHGRGYFARGFRHPGAGWQTDLYKSKHFSQTAPGTPVRCRGVRASSSRARDVLKISVPQRCLGHRAKRSYFDVVVTEPFEGGYRDELDRGFLRIRRG